MTTRTIEVEELKNQLEQARAHRKLGTSTRTITAVPSSTQSFTRTARKQSMRSTSTRQQPIQQEAYSSTRTRTQSSNQKQRTRTASHSQQPPQDMKASSRFMIEDSESESFEEAP